MLPVPRVQLEEGLNTLAAIGLVLLLIAGVTMVRLVLVERELNGWTMVLSLVGYGLIFISQKLTSYWERVIVVRRARMFKDKLEFILGDLDWRPYYVHQLAVKEPNHRYLGHIWYVCNMTPVDEKSKGFRMAALNLLFSNLLEAEESHLNPQNDRGV